MELQLKKYKELKEAFKNNDVFAKQKINIFQQLQTEILYLQQDQIRLTSEIRAIEELTGKSIVELDKLLKEFENGTKETYPDNVVSIHSKLLDDTKADTKPSII